MTSQDVLDLSTMTESDVLEKVQRAADYWRPRWDTVKAWRDLRYMRDNVRQQIPDELRTTDFEYHDGTFNKSCFELASFLSAAEAIFTVDPGKDSQRAKADDLEEFVQAIFESGGMLDSVSEQEVPFLVWQAQAENGHGVYKLTMPASYPLGMPQRLFFDDERNTPESAKLEPNDAYNPRGPKAERDARGQTKYRETDESLRARRSTYDEEAGFPFERHYVDAATVFKIKMGDRTIAQGEIVLRPATVLNRYGRGDLRQSGEKGRWVVYGEAHPEGANSAQRGRSEWVHCFEIWSPKFGYWGFLSNPGANGERTAMFADHQDWRWVNPLNRIPYFEALGLPSTDDDNATHLHGVFDGLIIETPMLNYLETIHFNAAHRQHLPQYQALPDPSYGGEKVPLNAEQQRIVTSEEIADQDLPPGWVWQPLSAGSEVNLFEQLKASRERMKEDALAAVLTGSSPGAGDSGAKVSLLINAANRAMSPIVRHHEQPLQQMASAILETAKRLKLTLRATTVRVDDNSSRFTRHLELTPDDIITTRVRCKLDIALPVDKAAMENRGMRLIEGGHLSYETAAPEYLGQNQPKKEQERITVGKFRPLVEQVAFGLAMKELTMMAPEIFADIVGAIRPPPEPSDSAGGGPKGVYGGASALLGTGAPALSGGQMDGMGGGVGVAGGGSFANP